MIEIADGRDPSEVGRLLAPFTAGHECFIVKPNFFKPTPGYYTDAETLDLILSLLPGRKYVVECYTAARTDRCRELSAGGGRDKLEEFRREDERFLRSTGIQAVLNGHGAEYLNVTEEVWAGRTADPRLIRTRVEKEYSPIFHKELYSVVPGRLLELKDPLFVNLAKFKVFDVGNGRPFYSLSMKNLFGLIPDPSRHAYHGNEYDGLARSITDICSVYCSLFPMVHLLEAIHSTLFPGRTELDGPVTDLGMLIASGNPVELDAFAVRLTGEDPGERHFLRMGAEAFGTWDEDRFPETPEEYRTFFSRLGFGIHSESAPS